MGKVDNQPLPVAQEQISRTSAGPRCSVDVSRFITFKCAAVLMLGVAAFVLGLFWVLPKGYREIGFDAKESVKQSAMVQAYFRLTKPISELLPYVKRLEYDLNGELGFPSSKVAVLSMHQEGKSNRTDVVFGFVPDPISGEIDSVHLSLLKMSLIDLFLQQFNLTVDSSIFGYPSSFEILKFPDGITLIPEKASLILETHPVLFRFNLNSSIYGIKKNLLDLKKQLKFGLHLMPNEAVYIKVTNKNGSTIDGLVAIEASVVSDIGFLSVERLKQLAQTLTSPAKNLGLDHYVFGKVKGIRLSSYLKHSLHAPAPTPSPSPAPSPDPIHVCSPSPEPSSSSSHSPQNQLHPSLSLGAYPPMPLVVHDSPYCGSGDPPRQHPIPHPSHKSPTISPPASTKSPLAGSVPPILPSPPPLPASGVAYDSRGPEERSRKDLVSQYHVSPSFSSFGSSASWRIQWLNLIVLLAVPLLVYIS